MADTTPTPLKLQQKIHLCWLLLFRNKYFLDLETTDYKERFGYIGESGVEKQPAAKVVQIAFFASLGLVLTSGVTGWAIARLLEIFGRCADPTTVGLSQIISAGLLLWATLFVRGWEIQTFAGVGFTERVNQWLYRGLCCIGTAIAVYSIAFQQCQR